MKLKASQLSKILDKHLLLIVCLLLLVVLRFPNLFEPNWYGDEAIYLTVGQAMRYGRELYTSIVDHKTPLIYYLAMMPNQLSFRFLTIMWMILTTVMFYSISTNLFNKKTPLVISNLVFVLLTSLPFLEGNIPNGELFVMGFVLAGIIALKPTRYWRWLTSSRIKLKPDKHSWKLIAAGSLLGLGVLTKVPAVLDFAAVAFIAWLQLFDGNHQRKLTAKISQFARTIGLLSLGLIIPILFSILYFMVQGRGQDYLQFGLLYNLHYTSNWQLNFNSPLLEFVFSLPGKTVLLGLSLAAISTLGRKLDRRFKFIFSWLLLTLYAALLSNRPYPHYFQQLVPAFSLLLGYLVKTVLRPKKITDAVTINLTLLILLLIVKIALLLNFMPYPTISYYQNFLRYTGGTINRTEYYQSFNPLMNDTYQAAAIIKQRNLRQTFIWGTNPMLYDLSDTIPTGRFTVSFHIKDIGAHESTLTSIKQAQPEMMVVMANESGDFPGFYQYLEENYVLAYEFEHMNLYEKNVQTN